MPARSNGFTLIELMIVIAILSIIASIAIPNLLASRLNANERVAISTLRSVASAQADCQAGAKIDVNLNSTGEYAYLAELSAAVDLRSGLPPVDPPLLSASFRGVLDGVVERSGYVFRMILPAVSGAGLPEADAGGVGVIHPDPFLAESFWVCYAWPADFGRTGNRVFVINQRGDLVFGRNQVTRYTGRPGAAGSSVPVIAAAFRAATTPDWIVTDLAIGSTATDGQTWELVQ